MGESLTELTVTLWESATDVTVTVWESVTDVTVTDWESVTDVTDAHIFSADTEDGKNPAAAVGAAIAGGGVDKVRITASLKVSQGVSRCL